MAFGLEFHGFSKEAIKFFRDLEKHNEKQWFEENRQIYEQKVLEPAKAFVMAMGPRLAKISPGVVADPRVNQSIFRIYRDARFSKDKSPYKTHLGIFFWEGANKKMENSGYYFQLDSSGIFLAAGLYIFPPTIMNTYRESVVDSRYGPALVKAAEAVTKKPEYRISGDKSKRVPRGYDPKHPLAEWLLYRGMYAYFESAHPAELHSAGFADYCFAKFKDMSPLHHWMRELTERG